MKTIRNRPVIIWTNLLLLWLLFAFTLPAQKARRPKEPKAAPVVAPPAVVPPPLPEPPPQQAIAQFQSAVTEIKLDNGLKILLQESHAVPVVAVGCWYRVGSKDDPAGAAGISHLVEHLNFRGSLNFPGSRLINLLEEAGAWNGYTSLDQTAYFETVAKGNLEGILKLEADRMSSALFEAETVKIESQRALLELSQAEGSPRYLLDTEVVATAFKRSPYRWPVVGWPTDLPTITREQTLQHYRQYYAPNNAILVLVGDFEKEKAMALIRDYFGQIPRREDPPRSRAVEPEQKGERRIKIVYEGSSSAIQLAYPAPDILNDDFYAMLILDAVLNGAKGMNLWTGPWQASAQKSSRLFRALVEKKLATAVHSELLPTQGRFLYRITAMLPDAYQFQPAEEAMIEQVERLKTYELSDLEMAKARNQLIAREFLDQASPSQRAHQLGYFESIASYKILDHFEEKLGRVSKEDLRRVAIRYFSNASRTVGWLVPAPPKPVLEVERLSAAGGTGGQRKGHGDWQKGNIDVRSSVGFVPGDTRSPRSAMFSRAAFTAAGLVSEESTAEQSNDSPAKEIIQIDRSGSSGVKPSSKTLDNGVTVIVAENRFSPTVTVRASMKAGSMRENDEQSGLANVTARMLERGTPSRNVTQLGEAFDFLGAQLSADTAHLLATYTAHGLSKDTPAFLQLLGEMFQNPLLSPSGFEIVRSETLGQLRELSQNPRWIAEFTLRERIYPEGHPFRRMAEGNRVTVEKLKLSDVTAFYRRCYRPDQLILSVAGDVQAEAVFEICEKNFGQWARTGDPEPFSIPAAAAGLGAGNHWIDWTGSGISQIVFGVPGPSIRHPDYYPLLILNHIFGQARTGGRLGTLIRDREGSIVALGSRFDANLAEGPFVIDVTAAPASVDRTIELIRQQLSGMRDSGISANEVASAKKALIHAWAAQLESNDGLARQLESIELYQLGRDYLQRYPQMIEGVSHDRLLDCSRTRFNFDQAALVIVAPSQQH